MLRVTYVALTALMVDLDRIVVVIMVHESEDMILRYASHDYLTRVFHE
jgi:hypothetical protein